MLVPVTVFGATFTQSETVFLAALADHAYTDGQLIIGNSATGGISFNTLTQGAGITITNGNGTISISASGSGVASVTGTANRITIGGTASDPTVDIAATYVGQTSITTLGTIGTGTWNATAIADGKIASALTGKTYNGLTVTSTTGSLTISNGKTLSASVSMTLQGGDASVLSIAAAKTLTVSNTLTFTGTDSSSVNFGAGGTVMYTGGATSLTIGSTTIASGTTTRILYDNAGTLGEYTLTGTGTVVVMATSPTFTTGATTPQLLATANDSGALGAAGTAFSDLFLAEGGVINWDSGDLTITQTGNLLAISGGTILGDNGATASPTYGFATDSGSGTGMFLVSSGILGFSIAGTGHAALSSTQFYPYSNDVTSLGSSGNAWSDLFLATGALVDFGNGNSVITHSSAVLTVSTGDLRVTTAGTNSASVVTVGGTQTLTAKTLTSPTITTAGLSGTQLLAEGASIGLDPAGSADGAYSGITMTGIAGYTQAFGDLVYLDPTDSRWEACDANSASGADGDARGNIAMVVVAGTDGNACTLLRQGVIRADAKFPSFTINNPIYVSETAGLVTQTQPTTTDVVIRIVGAALTADEMWFSPDNTWITHT